MRYCPESLRRRSLRGPDLSGSKQSNRSQHTRRFASAPEAITCSTQGFGRLIAPPASNIQCAYVRKDARLVTMRRLVLLIPWALGLVLLLTRVASAGDPIEALRQAEPTPNQTSRLPSARNQPRPKRLYL
jgi:hypothetical protein